MSSDLLTLHLGSARTMPPPSALLQPLDAARTDEIAAAYLKAYPPGVACHTLDEAAKEIRDTFAGEFGILRHDASAMAVHGGRVAGAILVVERSIWDADLRGPFVIDLFVDPDAQGLGFGGALVRHAIKQCADAGDDQLSLRVGEGTSPAAHTLYGQLGFTRTSE